MPQAVNTGCTMTCSFGAAPSSFVASSAPTVLASNMPMGTIMDFAPGMNIPPFGMCSSPSNPQVAAATAAALGVLTPMPCLPVTVAPWSPGSSTVKVGPAGFPALGNNAKTNCAWGGSISFITGVPPVTVA